MLKERTAHAQPLLHIAPAKRMRSEFTARGTNAEVGKHSVSEVRKHDARVNERQKR